MMWDRGSAFTHINCTAITTTSYLLLACHAHNQKSRIYAQLSPTSFYKLCESTVNNTYLMY